MIFTTIQQRIAENLNQLATDGVTIRDSQVVAASIPLRANEYYRDTLFPLFADAYPEDFEQTTYPYPTYTATSMVSSGTTTTITVSDQIFTNSMEGFTIKNSTLNATAKIVTYISTTSVVLDTSVGSTWNGGTIYVLGNEYTFGGDTLDLYAIRSVRIKYLSTDSVFKEAKLRQKKHMIETGYETFNTNSPYYYITSTNVGGSMYKTIGFEPFPTSETGTWQMTYIQRPPALTASDEPLLTIPGISQSIINGVTAWGKRVQAKYDEAAQWEEQDPKTGIIYGKGTLGILNNYKPRRANREKTRLSKMSEAIQMGRI